MDIIIKLNLKKAIVKCDFHRLELGKTPVNNINNLSILLLDGHDDLIDYDNLRHVLYGFMNRGYRQSYIERYDLDKLIDCVCIELGVEREELVEEFEI